jgi:hypothetical protein
MINFKQDGQCLAQDFNQAPPEYKSEVTSANFLGKILVLFVQFLSVLSLNPKEPKMVVCVWDIPCHFQLFGSQ